MDKQLLDRRSNESNPNNDAYWQARGYDQRPTDWRESYQIIVKLEREQRERQEWVSNLVNGPPTRIIGL